MLKVAVVLLVLAASCPSDAFHVHYGPTLRSSLRNASPNNLLRVPSKTSTGQRLERQAAFSGNLNMVAGVPEVGAIVASCLAPPALGLWRSEYTVSYGYGAAMFASGLLFLLSGAAPLGMAHALVISLYGFRLNAFLLYRELTFERFQKFVQKIENKADAKGSRATRIPFILGCAFLYFCMAAPLFVTAQTASGIVPTAFTGLAYAGFAFAAIGDFVKTAVKAKKGEDALVTSGPFALVRHPNYSGEMLLWTSSVLAAFSAAVASGTVLSNAGWLVASVLGAIGINFVLVQATTGLEKRQKEKYGEASHPDHAKYTEWVASSWKGFTFPPKPEGTEGEAPEAAKEESKASA